MVTIGAFIGHEHYIPHARLLSHSLRVTHPFDDEYELLLMAPERILQSELFLADEVVSVQLPQWSLSIPFADKLYAASVLEALVDGSMLIMDVDSCVLQPFDLPEKPIAVNPVDMRNIGELCDGKKDLLWDRIYHYFGIEREGHSVKTSISGEYISSYYNAGMVYQKEPSGLYTVTIEALQHLLQDPTIRSLLAENSLYRIFIHQAVLSVAMLSLYENSVFPLPQGVNYPLHLYDRDPERPQMGNLKSIRYDTFFDENPCPEQLIKHFEGYEGSLSSFWYYQL